MDDGGVVVMEQFAGAGGGVGPDGALVIAPPFPAEVLARIGSSGRSGTSDSGGSGRSGDAAGVVLDAPGVVGLLIIRAEPERAGLAAALETALGLALPERLSSTSADGRRLRWLSPDEWLLSCALDEAADVERRLRDAFGGFAAVTNVSGGYGVLHLDGPKVRELLARSTSLDVDPRVFPVDHVASTVFAKATVTLTRSGETRYELICRRSFADYVLRWIGRAL